MKGVIIICPATADEGSEVREIRLVKSSDLPSRLSGTSK